MLACLLGSLLTIHSGVRMPPTNDDLQSRLRATSPVWLWIALVRIFWVRLLLRPLLARVNRRLPVFQQKFGKLCQLAFFPPFVLVYVTVLLTALTDVQERGRLLETRPLHEVACVDGGHALQSRASAASAAACVVVLLSTMRLDASLVAVLTMHCIADGEPLAWVCALQSLLRSVEYQRVFTMRCTMVVLLMVQGGVCRGVSPAMAGITVLLMLSGVRPPP